MIRKRLKGIVISLWLSPVVMVAVATAATSSDEESANGRVALERFASDLSTFHATFEQVVLNSDGEIQDANEGEMWLSRPSLFRWEYGGDFPEVIVADGEKIWIYDVSLEQITVKDQSSLASDSPLTLLTDLTRLDQQFEVRDLGADEGLVYVELRSINDDAEFDRVLLGIEGQDLKLIAMEDAFGLRTEIRLISSNRNPELASDHFAFEPPENVDIVGDIAVDVDLNSEEAE
jgi:outer membrane lipoprotein carrier protein